MFKSRDSGTIISGLQELLVLQAERVELGRTKELAEDEIDSDTSKVINAMFDQGVKLAKLVDPSLRTGAKVAVGVFTGTPGGPALTAASSGPEGIASIVRELEMQGIPRDDITSGTLVIAAGKSAPKRFLAKYEDDNTDFLLTGADAAAVIKMALLGKGLTIYVDIKGKRYSRGVFDNTGMDQAEAPLKACLAQSEAAK